MIYGENLVCLRLILDLDRQAQEDNDGVSIASGQSIFSAAFSLLEVRFQDPSTALFETLIPRDQPLRWSDPFVILHFSCTISMVGSCPSYLTLA